MKKLHVVNVRQEESDMIPRHLAQYVDEPINSLPKIYKDAIKRFPQVEKIILEIDKAGYFDK